MPCSLAALCQHFGVKCFRLGEFTETSVNLYQVHGVTFGKTVFLNTFLYSLHKVSALSIDVCGVWCAICAV